MGGVMVFHQALGRATQSIELAPQVVRTLLEQADGRWRNDQVDGLADGLRGGPAEESLGGGIPVRDTTGADVADDHGVAGVREQRAEVEINRAGWTTFDVRRATTRCGNPRRCSVRVLGAGCERSPVRKPRHSSPGLTARLQRRERGSTAELGG